MLIKGKKRKNKKKKEKRNDQRERRSMFVLRYGPKQDGVKTNPCPRRRSLLCSFLAVTSSYLTGDLFTR